MECYHCKHPLTDWGFSTCCDRCLHYQHVCLTCKHYDPHKSSGCRVFEADPPSDKEAKNHCEYHQLEQSDNNPPLGTNSTTSAEQRFKDLFKE